MKMKESVIEEQKLELYHLLKDRYLIGDLLKKGEHSRIYRAYDTVLDQEITIKEFVPENPDMAETDTGNFIEEAGKFFGVYRVSGNCRSDRCFPRRGTCLYGNRISAGEKSQRVPEC